MIMIFNLFIINMNKLSILPNEILEIINDKLPLYNKRLFYVSCKQHYRNDLVVKILRFKFYIKLKLKIKNLFSVLSHYLHTYDYMLYNYSTGYYPFNNQCLIYAPVNQNKYLCRFCKNNRASHKYIYMMRIYNKLISTTQI